MAELDQSEARQVGAILSRLPPAHPARRAFREGRSLVDIAHRVEGMQPDVLKPLLELHLAQRRRLGLVHPPPHPRGHPRAR